MVLVANGDVFEPGIIPVAQILRTRRDFPKSQLSFEVQLQCNGWAGIAGVAEACATAGLELISLKYLASGIMLCTLNDCRTVDFHRFMASLERFAVVSRWTTLISH